MHYVLGGLWVVFVLAFVIGALTGHVRVRPCGVISEPSRDARRHPAVTSPERGGESVGREAVTSTGSSAVARAAAQESDVCAPRD